MNFTEVYLQKLSLYVVIFFYCCQLFFNRILSFVVQETRSLNRCDSDVQINVLARCRMCNEKFFILITMLQCAWYTIGISHSFYSHHVCLMASVALALVLKGHFTSDRVSVIISSIQLYDLVKNSILIPAMTPC